MQRQKDERGMNKYCVKKTLSMTILLCFTENVFLYLNLK